MLKLSLCEDFRILNVILIIKNVLKIISILAPIVLIVLIIVRIVKYITSSGGESDYSALIKYCKDKIILAVCIFLIPTFISTVMLIFNETNDARVCYDNATSDKVEAGKASYNAAQEANYKMALAEIEKAKKEFERLEEERQKNSTSKGGGISGGSSSITGVGSNKMAQLAIAEIGNNGSKYTSWYGTSSGAAYCAIFVSWVANQAGYLNSAIPRFALCSNGVNYFKSIGRWKDRNYTPSPGDLIFFDWRNSRDGVSDHVGIVVSVSGGNVTYVGGNEANGLVAGNSYAIGYDSILGYGVPNY